MSSGPPWRPPDGMRSPRYGGVRSFMRLPHVTQLDGVDFAVAGVPFDTGATYRVGARFGPEAIRSASVLLRPYHPDQEVALFPTLSGVDYGDLPTVPGYLPRSHRDIAAAAETLFRAGVTPVFLGGDHSVSLPLLRAAGSVRDEPLSLLHFDSHGDIWSGYYGGLDTHGTPFRRALEEGLIDPRQSIQIGLRGSVYDEQDVQLSRDLGFQVVTARDLHRRGVDEVLRQVQDLLRGRDCYLSFDIDFVDPAFAPGTGTPETGGFSGAVCHELLRGLRGLHFVAFDMVEVLPAHDPAGVTALLAANLVYEFIALLALQKRDGRGA
ncbi:MAG: agmatinase [Anaerolineaceae bacterium]|nr:agmatinase [Anaerolineaceae bacterium]MDE0327700.1 agmatinase [Anaerolineaceae bacterium]